MPPQAIVGIVSRLPAGAGVLIQKPLEFSAFPTVLLLATLFRLSLNVASTRVVLLEGHTGPGAAGAVIEAFGHFLIGGNFDNGKGNLTTYGSYYTREGVFQSEFDYSRVSQALLYGYDLATSTYTGVMSAAAGSSATSTRRVHIREARGTTSTLHGECVTTLRTMSPTSRLASRPRLPRRRITSRSARRAAASSTISR